MQATEKLEFGAGVDGVQEPPKPDAFTLTVQTLVLLFESFRVTCWLLPMVLNAGWNEVPFPEIGEAVGADQLYPLPDPPDALKLTL